MATKALPLGKGTYDFLIKKELIDLISGIQALLADHPDKIVLPVDVALNVDDKRVEIPVTQLPSEYPIFGIGTKTIFETIASSDALSLAGGGNTIAAIGAHGLTYNRYISHCRRRTSGSFNG